jgi:hypothetical protein
MKRLLFVSACMLMAAIAVPAFAQGPPPGNYLLGIYTATGSTGWAHLGTPTTPVGGQITLYLIASGMDSDGVQGWEAHVSWPDDQPWFWLPAEFEGLNLSQEEGDFIVGSGGVLPTGMDGQILLATIKFIISGGAGELYLHPASNPSHEGEMVYVPGRDFTLILPFNWSSGSESEPVFCINMGACDPPVPAERSSWGQIKGLYR